MSIINDPKSLDANSESDIFWKSSKAVKTFIDEYGVPPLTGIFPDMTADTDSFITLQKLYQAKSQQDLENVKQKLAAIKGSSLNQAEVEFVTLFCKNLLMLEVTRFKSLQEEAKHLNTEEITSGLYEDNPVVE